MAIGLLLNAISMTFASSNYIRYKLVVFRTALPIIVLAIVFSPMEPAYVRGLGISGGHSPGIMAHAREARRRAGEKGHRGRALCYSGEDGVGTAVT
jgi:hypothetical protein